VGVDRERMILGSIAFGITYILIAVRRLRWIRIDRASGAIIGGVLAVAIGSVTPEEAAAAVDHSTLVLLLAVMGMGAFLSIDGFFDRAAVRLMATARTRARLLAAVVWGAGTLSAFITNDAVCVLAAPLIVRWIQRWNLPRLPFLLALATAANTGSVATLVGNPQNMLCASLGKLGFAPFMVQMVPVAVLSLVVNHLILRLLFKKDLAGELPQESAVGSLFTTKSVMTLVVIAGTVVAYVVGGHMTYTALTGFAILLILHRVDPGEVWARIDWSVLLFFGGLFISVDGFVRSGAPAWVFARVPLFEPPEGLSAYTRTAGFFLLGSNVVTNVPFILLVRDQMASLPSPRLGWEMLAMASTFAGNLTLLGSVANIIVSEKSQEIGGLRFGEYAKAGLPIAIATTLVGTTWLVLVRPEAPPSVRTVIEAPDRSAEDKALDAGRKPGALLAFCDVRQGARAAELAAAGGYTAELLARAVGPTGKVWGQNSPKLLADFAEKPWSARLAKPENANVVRVDRELDDPLPPDATGLDVVVLNLFYHDTVWLKIDRAKMNRRVHAALRPGGAYCVLDHSARAGAGTSDAATLHRIEQKTVEDEVGAAGFRLADESQAWRNPSDGRDWSADPPDAKDRRGTSDRFALRFVKPE
jgi:Na+/H+ antiporter NhaD/arsenite permease-like protein/predicted methyltransferase